MSTTDQVSNQIDARSPLSINVAEPDVARSDSRQWTLKGLAPETVEVSRDAAKRSGMKLNAWVSRALSQAATGANNQPANGDSSANSREGDETIQRIQEELVRLRAQNEDMRNTVNTMSGILLKLCADKI
ncbi:hypothetical protein [Sphingomonas sp. PB4P5]|uniref:hypothetical protein n=1 Tax=Parasphingomonas puruogangriensis TaxID=3096155 RepID=UPI002FC8FC95